MFFIDEQKQKLAKLESVKLSEDFLENIDDEPKKVTKKMGKIEKDYEDDDMRTSIQSFILKFEASFDIYLFLLQIFCSLYSDSSSSTSHRT